MVVFKVVNYSFSDSDSSFFDKIFEYFKENNIIVSDIRYNDHFNANDHL